MNSEYLSIHAAAPWSTGDRAPKGHAGYQISKAQQRESKICLHCPAPDCKSGAATCPILRRGKQTGQMQNDEIRAAIASAGLRQKQVYEALDIPRSTWSAWMHKELSEELREKVFRAIAELKKPKEILETYDLACCRSCYNRAMCERDLLTCSARAKEQAV